VESFLKTLFNRETKFPEVAESDGYDVVNYSPNEVADAVFYARHPELNERKIRPGETTLAREWNAIQNRLPEFVCYNY